MGLILWIICVVSGFFIRVKGDTQHHLLVDKLRLDFMNAEEKLWRFVLWDAPTLNREDSELYVIKAFKQFDKSMKQMPQDILRGTDPIRKIHAFLFLYSEIKQTENLYEKFRQFLKEKSHDDPQINSDKKWDTLTINQEAVIADILNPKTGANATVYQVYNLTFSEENMSKEIIDLLLDQYPCKDFKQSPQQIYFNLYNVIALNGLKSYIMIQFAYLIKRISEKGNYSDLSEITKVNFEKRVNETMSVFRGDMEIVPAQLWKCDPKKHVKGKTYDEFTRLLQGHIQNEVDMNSAGTCREDCAAYRVATSYGCYDSDSKYCKELERCNGKILNCQFVESHMQICPSKSGERRYEYVQYESGRTMGKNVSCWKKPIDSWWRWFVRCSYCICLCDEQSPKSDRYINLRPVLANITENRVVTGLRFTKHNRILHLQIQEGRLMPYGYIDNRTVSWRPVDDYKITDPGYLNEKDYYTMTYDSRDMALDDIEMNNLNHVVTGVKFKLIDGKIRLQIHVSKFDWPTGLLWPREGNFIYKAHGGKNKIDLDGADIPTLSPSSEMNYKDDTYISFTHTDFNKDAAQTTIPFIDIQPVVNEPQVPLMGAGIYYKGVEGYGGFVAPKIKTYDYSELILVRFKHDAKSMEFTAVVPVN